jgi:phage shock protein A
MAEASSRRRRAAASAQLGQKDFVSKLTEAGEDALQRLTELPGGQRAVGAFNDLRNRVDELSKKVRGIDELEERVTKLEREVASLKRTRPKPRRSSTSRTRSTPPSAS